MSVVGRKQTIHRYTPRSAFDPKADIEPVAGRHTEVIGYFLRRELYIKGKFWQASAEQRLAEDWRRMSPRAMAAHVLERGRAAPNSLLVD
jgi:hypothetical protein